MTLNGVFGSHDPVNVWVLNGNSSKMAKATDFKFDMHVPETVPTCPLKNFQIRKCGHWPGSHDL